MKKLTTSNPPLRRHNLVPQAPPMPPPPSVLRATLCEALDSQAELEEKLQILSEMLLGPRPQALVEPADPQGIVSMANAVQVNSNCLLIDLNELINAL